MFMYTKALTSALADSDLLDVEASFELRWRLRPSHCPADVSEKASVVLQYLSNGTLLQVSPPDYSSANKLDYSTRKTMITSLYKSRITNRKSPTTR
jgi:hypothetical protein